MIISNQKAKTIKSFRVKTPIYLGVILQLISYTIEYFDLAFSENNNLGSFGTAILLTSFYYITVIAEDEEQLKTYKYVAICGVILSIFVGTIIYLLK